MLIKNIFSLKTFLCISLCCFSLLTNSQNTTQKDTLAQYSFEELHDKSYSAKPDSLKALLYANYHLKKALKNKDTLNIASSYYILSSITNDTLSFINYWRKILSNNKLNPKLQIIGSLNLGDFYYHRGIKGKALRNYLKANNIAVKNKNDSLKNISMIRLGFIKSYNKNYPEAIKLFKSSLNYYDKKGIKKDIYNYCSILLSLSGAFEALNLYDSAFQYNNTAYLLAIKYKDKTIKSYTGFNNGGILFKKKKYQQAITFLQNSLKHIILDENYFILSKSYFLLGSSYNKLNDKKNALKYYQKIDSLFLSTKNYYKNQKPAYKYLIAHYKEKNNYMKQLEYINKYIKVDSVLNARSKSISKNLTENYDIPNLLAEKKAIENRLKGKLSTTKKWMFGVGVLAFLLSVFLIHQVRKRKLYKQRFQELMSSPIKEVITKEKIVAKKEQSIPKETVENILTLLKQFEANHQYISHKITLSILAKTFETNSKYLSQVINQHKGKSFNNYVNQLRIKYTLQKLKKDSTFRKYSIKAIAYEVGFNTTESFSKAFYKNTGIKPSFFIKELEKK